jgi:hypothetical protein
MEYDEDRKHDPAFKAVDEGGGGYAEGFEQSEDMLIQEAEDAEHTDALEGFPDEGEGEPDEDKYGEADEIVGEDY